MQRIPITILSLVLAAMLFVPIASGAGEQGEPVLLAQNQPPPPPPPAAQPGAPAQPADPAQPGETLPRTASNAPLLALLGVLAVMGAIVLRRQRPVG